MINRVTVTNPLSESVTMELRFPEQSGFLVRGIEGLGPVAATINMAELSTGDGSIYNSSRAMQRNLVFSLLYGSNQTAEQLRHKIYKYFPLKRRINVRIETDERDCETYGYVETNEQMIFSREAGCTISVICPDSYLYGVEKQVTVFGSVDSLFSFPFSNESTSNKLIQFSQISQNSVNVITYLGDCPIGFELFIHATGVVTNVNFIKVQTLENIKIDNTRLTSMLGSGIVAGDDIVISTIQGQKHIYLTRSGTTYNILNALTDDSEWFSLDKGDNSFIYTADVGVSNMQIRAENRIAYEGV